MGYGDEIMASGMARGAAARGKRIAFGDGTRIIWGPHCAIIFKGNPNVAPPGSERAPDLEWIAHYKGHRLYNHQEGDRWVWHMDFRPVPGEIFFDKGERIIAARMFPGFVLIEPNVSHKSVEFNKQWSFERFQEVTDRLLAQGYRVVQLKYNGARHHLRRVEHIRTESFRHGLAVLSRAALYVGHEGGMHHGAAALNVPGVVIFGGFIPPEVTGYDTHINLAAGDRPACGSHKPCMHCREAMSAITVEQVMQSVSKVLDA